MLASYFGYGTPEDQAEQNDKQVILITGVTGFIGAQLLNYCLDQEKEVAANYQIRATVRNPMDAEKLHPLYEWFGGEDELAKKVDVVHLDLEDDESIDNAVEGVTYILHTASPVGIYEPTDPNEMIRPAVEGTLSVMRAAVKHRVKRVVVTSSIAAIETQTSEFLAEDPVLDESLWSNLEAADEQHMSSYAKAKTLAEKAAWDFLENLAPGEHRPELVTILPGLVLGEYICGGASSSPALIKSIIMNSMPGIPRLAFSAVDMSDVV